MEKIFGEILGMFLVSGTVGMYSLIAVILLIVGYYKHLRPYLADFEEIKVYLKTIPNEHTKFNDKIDGIDNKQKSNHKEMLDALDKKINESVSFNETDHNKISVEFSKVKYLIEQLAQKEDKLYDKNEDAFSEIILALTKLETRLDYQNQGLGGMRK